MTLLTDRSSEAPPPVAVFSGIAGSPGLAIGRARVIDTGSGQIAKRNIKQADADDEVKRFSRAIVEAIRGLRAVGENLDGRVAKAESSILEAYVMMLEDEAFHEDVARHVSAHLKAAEWAVDSVICSMADQLRAATDPYLVERSRDFEFIGKVVQRALGGHSSAVENLDEPCILVAHDMSPAEAAGLNKEKVIALVTEIGSRTSHTAILARALEIPAVMGVPDLLSRVSHQDTLIVDGSRGKVTLWPTQEVIEAEQDRARKHQALTRDRQVARPRPATTQCGERLHIRANIDLPIEAKMALQEGAEGIGLYRTEFLCVDRLEYPNEEEQFEVYRSVLSTAGALPVTLRTFDLGGEKFSAASAAPKEANPALGLRAVRLSLSQPEQFLVQLRAMVRASAFGEARIMIPMITGIDEFRSVRALLRQAIAEVDAKGLKRAAHISLGAMIEVPAAAIMAPVIAEEAEFLCIGTNDLVQYALAVDRSSREMAQMASPFDPAILRLIRSTVQGAEQWNRAVSVCGAMASDPFAAVLLIGLGVRDLSMEAPAIWEIKEVLSRVSVQEATLALEVALQLKSSAEIESALKVTFAPRFVDLTLDD